MKLREALTGGEAYLRERQIPDASVDAWYLMEYVLKDSYGNRVDRAWYLLHREEEMLPAQYARYETLLRERGTHVPLQHITGEQEFMGIPFLVTDQVLVPRQDTELLCEEALKVCRAGMQVLDLCTGSGCIVISLMKHASGLLGSASDVSAQALEVARENARRQSVCVDFRQGDLFSCIDGSFDLIVSNPPYIPTGEIDRLMEEVRCFDPRGALDGREDGLYFYRKITRESPSFLKQGGWLMVEIGYDQGPKVAQMMTGAGLSGVQIIKDLSGLDRVVKGRKS